MTGPSRGSRISPPRNAIGLDWDSLQSVDSLDGSVVDPFGYQWNIATRKEDLTREEMDRRAQEFFKQFAAQQAHA